MAGLGRTATIGLVAGVCAAMVVGATLVVVLGGDGDGGTAQPLATAAPSTTASGQTLVDASAGTDVAAAEQVVVDYRAALDAAGTDGDVALSTLADYSRGTEYTSTVTDLKNWRTQGYVQTGAVQVVDLSGETIDGGKRSTVQVSACFDVSAVDLVDADGTSLVSDDRLDRGIWDFVVEKYDDGWYVTGSEVMGETC